jgi:hypothetical protein
MGWYPHARGGVACGGQGRTLARSQMYTRGLYPVILQSPHILTVKKQPWRVFRHHTHTQKSLTRPHESGPCVLYPACRSFKRVNGARAGARARGPWSGDAARQVGAAPALAPAAGRRRARAPRAAPARANITFSHFRQKSNAYMCMHMCMCM